MLEIPKITGTNYSATCIRKNKLKKHYNGSASCSLLLARFFALRCASFLNNFTTYVDSILSVGQGICTRPTSATGYKLDYVVEQNLQMGPEFRVSNVSCAPGWWADSNAEAKTCSSHQDPYALTGCTRGIRHTVNQNFCSSPGPECGNRG